MKEHIAPWDSLRLKRTKVRAPIIYGLAALLSLSFFSVAQAQQKVSKIVVENIGPPAASESLVRANIRSK